MAVAQAVHIRDGKVMGYQYSLSSPRLLHLFSDVKWMWRRLKDQRSQEQPIGSQVQGA
jgi:hypothetical protein